MTKLLSNSRPATYPSYDSLAAQEYIHATVNHVDEYVRGQIHTQGIENNAVNPNKTGVQRLFCDRLFPMPTRTQATMDRVRRIFERSGLSLAELGLRMGYTDEAARKSAWQFLRKTADPRLSMLEKFAEALNVSITDLVK